MNKADYHQQIIEYYRDTENAYKDSWDLERSLAIHYGYSDRHTKTFRESLLRMNQMMLEAANITQTDLVMDAGCGVGGGRYIYCGEMWLFCDGYYIVSPTG